MIKVMIVDDEPFIRKGLKIIINWEEKGYRICGEASNGQEAIKLMEKEDFDLIITDIKMPVMDGMDLIEYTKKHISKKIKFIILSGFYEFEYAKKAIQYEVADYVLKPVKKEELISVLNSYRQEHFTEKENTKKLEYSEKIIIDQHINNLFAGDRSEDDYEYLKKHLRDVKAIRYIGLETSPDDKTKAERLEIQKLLYEEVKNILCDYLYHLYLPSDMMTKYSVAIVYAKAFADDEGIDDKEFVERLHKDLSSRFEEKVYIYVGHMVEEIKMIQETYRSAVVAKKFQVNNFGPEIVFYDDIKDEIEVNKYPLDKEKLDDLIKTIEMNDKEKMIEHIEIVSNHFKSLAYEPEMVKMNIDYLLVQIVNIASELEPELEHDDIERFISYEDYDRIVVRGDVDYFREFTLDFAEYINSLRKNTFGGTLTNVINEININYKENLTLKSLSEKYYINSAYLGQIFRKKFNCSFKDYLNNFRIEKASELLRRTDDKIYEIATAVGFNSTDYFISKFVQLKGTTPLQYRKQFIVKTDGKQ